MKISGEMNTAAKVPMPWAIHCLKGDVRRRKPTRKSPIRSVAWLAPMLVKAPPRRFMIWDWGMERPEDLVTPPRTICEAFDTPVMGVISGHISYCAWIEERIAYLLRPSIVWRERRKRLSTRALGRFRESAWRIGRMWRCKWR